MSSFSAQDLFNLDGAVAVVSGGGTGIGLMAAKALATNGAKVYITGRRGQILEQAIKAHGSGLKGSIHAIQADVSSKEDLQKVKSQISEGYLNVLINNAGIIGPENKLGEGKESMSASEISKIHIENETFQQWDDLFRINISSVFFTTMTLLPLLDAGNKKPPAGRNSNFISSVINITSISGIVKISQGHYAYNSSKAATNSLTMMLANELKFGSAANIRVNAIAPGLFPTEMTSRGKASTDGITHPDQLSGFINPAGRPGEAEEMANAILFLATNSYVTGQIIAVDGGFVTSAPSSR